MTETAVSPIGQITYNASVGTLTVGDMASTITSSTCWSDNWGTYCYPYTTYVPSPNKDNYERAFKVVQHLLETKTVKTESIKKVMELIEGIAEIL